MPKTLTVKREAIPADGALGRPGWAIREEHSRAGSPRWGFLVSPASGHPWPTRREAELVLSALERSSPCPGPSLSHADRDALLRSAEAAALASASPRPAARPKPR